MIETADHPLHGYTRRDTKPFMDSLTAWINVYVDERKRNRSLTGRSPRSIRYRLESFAEHVGADRSPCEVTRAEVEEWMGSGDWSDSTIRSRLSAVKQLYFWLSLRTTLTVDPTRGIRSPKVKRAVPRALSTEVVGKVFTACPDVRAELICSLMVQSALRCEEVANVEVTDIDRRAGTIFVREGKGGHDRLVPLFEETEGLLVRYLAQHPAQFGPLIRSYTTGRGMHPTYVSDLVSKVMRDAGVKMKARDGVSAHALRHTAASDTLEACGDLTVVQELLGHTSLSSTQVYLRRANVLRMREGGAGRTYRGLGAGLEEPPPSAA